MPQPELTLYSFRRCPYAMRVRMVLHEKNLPFHTIEEDLKNFSSNLMALHPEAKVPVLVHKDLVLYESAIITEYLDEAFPTVSPLMPADPKLRAQIRLWTYWCNYIVKPDLDRLKYGAQRFPEKDCAGADERMQKCVNRIEEALKLQPWIMGERMTLADIHLFPFFRQLARLQPPPEFLSQFPKTQAWMQMLSRRPSFEKTMEPLPSAKTSGMAAR